VRGSEEDPGCPAAHLFLGDVVVEAGAGEGYGVELLRAGGIDRVVALDYDLASLHHAVSAYPAAVGGRAARANLAHLPLAEASAAAVVSLQVIEHLWTPWEFLADCARVLRPGGLLVVTTPNRPTFSPGLGRGEKPPNPFHVKEYDAQELRATVAGHLEVTGLLGVRHGERIEAWEAAHGSLVAAQLASPVPSWSPGLREMVASITAADFVVQELPDDDERMLDLVLMATRGAG
jgi:SAM-dependent methyltransferase